MSILALVLIVEAICGLLGFGCWLVDRGKPEPMAKYRARWKVSPFRGW
jgi:hypothetical protein